MGDVIGLLPIIPMESKGNAKGRVCRAHGTLRLFMTELEVSLLSSRQGSHTLRKKWDSGRFGRKDT